MAFLQTQPAAQRALKAVMCLRGLGYRRPHDLEELAGRVTRAGCHPSIEDSGLRLPTPCAVEYRYDDEAPELLASAQALAIVASLLAWADAHGGRAEP